MAYGFNKNIPKNWGELLDKIFEGQIPESKVWTNKREILRVFYQNVGWVEC